MTHPNGPNFEFHDPKHWVFNQALQMWTHQDGRSSKTDPNLPSPTQDPNKKKPCNCREKK